MKYLIIFLSLFIIPMVIAAQSKIPEIINVNNTSFFSINKEKGAFVNFDISLVTEDQEKSKMVLSLYLADTQKAGQTSEFLIYPVDILNKKIGNNGIVIKTKTEPENYVDFTLPIEIFGGIKEKIGFIILSNQEGIFSFYGTNNSVNDPSLTIVHDDKPRNLEEQLLDLSKRQNETDKLLNKIYNNTEKRWYEKLPFSILFWLIGAVILALLVPPITQLLKKTISQLLK